MKRKLLTIPNLLSIIRLVVLSPLFVYFAFKGEGNLAFAVGVVALLSDFLDGYIAVKFNQRSRLGSILDTAGDMFFSIALVFTVVFLGYVNEWMILYLGIQRLVRTRLYFYVLNRFNTIYKPMYMKVTGAGLMVYAVFLPTLVENFEKTTVDIITWIMFTVAWILILIGVYDTTKKTKSGFFKQHLQDD
ncbi:CDP-alcohol phosphatidyltransferase family protein [Candidatus Peregrinibacteria bacterium]|jgi:phosphatidylglycerophosphate synthase|nr:CDP-alcohol phosphatidyltransferase family protein [Candidatus Peregrinibacteria bacterium]MBT4056356.1 CDP-alcohol phosphatidyltransferase family protein [Candidatus Peregrinibacteria bacterium]